MSDAMSFAELAEQYVDLLPARTVLSLSHAGIDGIAGVPGAPGSGGANGSGTPGTTMWMLFGGYDQSNPGLSIGDASSKSTS
jgi:hypothetical protein